MSMPDGSSSATSVQPLVGLGIGPRAIVGCLACLAVAACDSTDPGPVAGHVAVDLATEVSTLGAIQFVVRPPTEGAISQVTPSSGYKLYQRELGDGSIRVVIVGTLRSGELLRFGVPDRSQATAYDLTPEAAADRVTFDLVAVSTFGVSARLLEDEQ